MNEESDISEFEPKIDNSNILTDHQQEKLNDLKVNVARENSKYLAAHLKYNPSCPFSNV